MARSPTIALFPGTFDPITNGHLDDVPVDKIKAFESAFLEYVKTSAPDIAKGITETNDITDEIANKLNTALGDFKSMASY